MAAQKVVPACYVDFKQTTGNRLSSRLGAPPGMRTATARVVKSVDTRDLKSLAVRHAGSIPASGTKISSTAVQRSLRNPHQHWLCGFFVVYGSLWLSIAIPPGQGVFFGVSRHFRHTPKKNTPTMPLTDTTCRQAKPAEKPYKLADSGGLYLLVNQAGKYWRWKYRFLGKEKVLALGVYPTVSLAEVRNAHQEARKLLANGIDPGEQKKADRRAEKLASANSFEAVALAWLDERGQMVDDLLRLFRSKVT